MSFTELRDRLQRLVEDKPISEKSAGAARRSVTAQAARLYAKHSAEFNSELFNPEVGTIKRSGNLTTDEKLWELAWLGICQYIAIHRPEQVPSGRTMHQPEWRDVTPVRKGRSKAADGVTVIEGRFAPANWRQRAEDDITVLQVLAEWAFDPENWWAARSIAKHTDVTPEQLRKAVERGRLKAQRVGKETRYYMPHVRHLWPDRTEKNGA